MNKDKWFLNGGRGSGRAFRLLCETYENKISNLEAQIEKMKCCTNCIHSRTEYKHCKTDKHEKWEIKEND